MMTRMTLLESCIGQSPEAQPLIEGNGDRLGADPDADVIDLLDIEHLAEPLVSNAGAGIHCCFVYVLVELRVSSSVSHQWLCTGDAPLPSSGSRWPRFPVFVSTTILARPCELADADFAATGPRPPVQETKTMNLTQWGLLVLLSVLWGRAFFFVGVAVVELPPLTVVLARVGDRSGYSPRSDPVPWPLPAAHAVRMDAVSRHGIAQQCSAVQLSQRRPDHGQRRSGIDHQRHDTVVHCLGDGVLPGKND